MSPRAMVRFWSRVNKLGPTPDQAKPEYKGLGPCWDWTAGKDRDGYGLFSMDDTGFKTHRLSFLIHNTEGIQQGLHVMHKCDRPQCVNPQHLRLGTSTENVRDRNAKGRQSMGDSHWQRRSPANRAIGSRQGSARLTESQIVAIRESKLPAKDMATLLGVHWCQIYRIRAKRSWKHVG